jgi:RNA polymerase sigma-70 factor (ECF subfamily)
VAQEAPAELIDQARRDRGAFGHVYDLYVHRIYGFAVAHSRTREDAEDLTALTFERALSAIGGYQERGAPFSQWLYRIAANLAIDRARRTSGVVIQGESAISAIGSEDDYANPARLAERWERANRLLDCVARLPTEQQEAVRLRFYADRSFAEIGDAMVRSESAAKQLVYRAVRQLRLVVQRETFGDA